MNKLLFQIGALAFFISAVVFSVQQFSFFDTIARAFIVFMAIELLGTALLVVVSYLQAKQKPATETEQTETQSRSAMETE